MQPVLARVSGGGVHPDGGDRHRTACRELGGALRRGATLTTWPEIRYGKPASILRRKHETCCAISIPVSDPSHVSRFAVRANEPRRRPLEKCGAEQDGVDP